jgi:probable HAF family extracellular repeat protein
MNKNSVIKIVATIIVVAFNFISNGADVKYQIVDLGTLGGNSSYATAINASGRVVGDSALSNGRPCAFVWYNGSIQGLIAPNKALSYAAAINDNNQIAGSYRLFAGVMRYIYLYSDGLMQTGDIGDVFVAAHGINNSGQIVCSDSRHIFLYSNGSMRDLGLDYYYNVAGINNLGNIVGDYSSSGSGETRSFIYINGTMMDINTDYSSAGYCINDKNQIAGAVYAKNGSYTHPYFYDGSLKDIGTLGGNNGYSLGINYNGEVVGCSQTSDGDDHAFIYSAGKMKDLNSVLLNGLGWTLTRATGINTAGQIVGSGINPSGQQRAFLLNPVSMAPIQVITNTPAQLTLGICPVKDPAKNSLVVITHGWQPPSANILFVDNMSSAIINNLSGHGVNNWQVFGYKWLNGAKVFNPSDALNNAKQEGKHLGESIVAQGWTHVHFIAHSAGAALIQSATEVIKTANSSIVVHETFLDPFVDSNLGGIYTYGRRADWADQYFCRDGETVWDPFSNMFVFAPYTQSPVFHSYNVDVSFLDSHKTSYNKFSSTPNGVQITETCTKYVKTTHGWPVEFYMNTITGNTTTDYASFGFALSKEGGNWDAVSGYGVGNGTELNPSVPIRVLGTNLVCTAVTPRTSSYFNFIPDFTQSPTIQSETGIIQKYMDHINLLSGSPVWLSTVVIPTNPVNFVSFDAEFTSSVGARGVLTVLWDTNTIGTLDERFIEPGLQHYRFSFLRAEANSLHFLGLRLEPFIDIQSSLTLTNVVFNYVGVTQPFSLSIATNTVNNLRMWRLDGEAGFNYSVQASTNLNSSDWTDIAILENTNGAVFFYDADQNIYNQRFYRAVAPY